MWLRGAPRSESGVPSLPDGRNTEKLRLKPLPVLVYACLKSLHSKPNCLMTDRRVPVFKSLPPQSGRGAIRSVRGLCHTRCEPFPRRGTCSQPNFRNFLAASRYVTLL